MNILFQKSPLHKAAIYGNTEVGLYLLQEGAIVYPDCFKAIIRGGLEYGLTLTPHTPSHMPTLAGGWLKQ